MLQYWCCSNAEEGGAGLEATVTAPRANSEPVARFAVSRRAHVAVSGRCGAREMPGNLHLMAAGRCNTYLTDE